MLDAELRSGRARRAGCALLTARSVTESHIAAGGRGGRGDALSALPQAGSDPVIATLILRTH